MNQELANYLNITNQQIRQAIQDRKDGEGVTTIGYTLGLNHDLIPSQWDQAITDLGIFDDDYEIIEIKRNIPLAFVKLASGAKKFMARNLIPSHMQEAHWAERRLETQDGQA
jgi:hypothetical protein